MNRIISGRKFRCRANGVGRALIGLGVPLAMAVSILMAPLTVQANPYTVKPGEAPVTVAFATCATTGGFIHAYTAMDNGLFDKYGIKINFVPIQGSKVALPALASDQIQFLYCAADATIPGLAAGIDGKLVAAVHIGLPWILLARKDIKKVEDLKGKSIGVTQIGSYDHRVTKALLKRFNLEKEVTIRAMGGGSQSERYQAMVMDIIQATPLGAPLDVRGKRDGFNLIYDLNALSDDPDLPAIYSSLLTNSNTLKKQPDLVQRFVAAIAETIHFAEKNPEKAKASIAKALKLDDPEALQSAYNAYAKALINRRMLVPAHGIEKSVEIAREEGTSIKKKPSEIFDNTFVENLDKSGFLKELWGGEVPVK